MNDTLKKRLDEIADRCGVTYRYGESADGISPDKLSEIVTRHIQLCVKDSAPVIAVAVLEEAAKRVCLGCQGKSLSMSGEEVSDVHRVPVYIEKPTYIPNSGTMSGYIHEFTWGGSAPCLASAIHRLIAEIKKGEA